MASPLGHSFLGIALSNMMQRDTEIRLVFWYAFAIVAANAPDLDFIPGLFVGDINRFHQGMTHSLAAAIVFGFIVGLASRPFSMMPFRLSITAVILYTSHLLLDMFCEDKRAPFGIPLLWPLSSIHFIFPWSIFKGVKHGVPGDEFEVFLKHLFSWDNIKVLALEMVVLVPLMFLTMYMMRRTSNRKA